MRGGDIPRPHPRDEAVIRAVGKAYRLFQGAEGRYRDDRPEHLVLADRACRIDVIDDGRLKEEAVAIGAARERVAAPPDRRMGPGCLDKAPDPGALTGGNQWPHIRIFERRADFDGCEPGADLGHDILMDALMNQQPRAGRTGLAGILQD